LTFLTLARVVPLRRLGVSDAEFEYRWMDGAAMQRCSRLVRELEQSCSDALKSTDVLVPVNGGPEISGIRMAMLALAARLVSEAEGEESGKSSADISIYKRIFRKISD